MKIVVLVKYVPEPTATWRFAPDLTLDRGAVEGRLSELDEYAVEQAVRLVEGGLTAEIVYLTVGPAKAVDGLRKALSIGGDSAVHVNDAAIHGSDSLATSLVLAKALESIGYDLVMAGMASTDAEMSVVPSMVADRLGINQATFAGQLTVDGSTVSIRRDSDTASEEVSTSLPAIVSVTDQNPEARYPAFRAIMQSKKKPVTTMTLADLGLDASQVGLGASATKVLSVDRSPARQAGALVTDDGTGATQLADFLASKGFV
ncbi:MAG TPA: electron transfer flavoprotein subunit beta/FixA family protein [Candidatus Lustribacter sp.]|nr:electron transfer flavoprotein subunit beta/FixA family protein [Candidatus Lustribacter sp.]